MDEPAGKQAMKDHTSENSFTADCLGVRLDSKSIVLTTGYGAIELRCRNEPDQYENVVALVEELSVELVTVVANNGIERHLVDWLRVRGVETVVLHLPTGEPSLIDNLVNAWEVYENAKMIFVGIAAVVGGVFIFSMGIQADQNGNAIVPGGIWNGAVIILFGIALLAIYVRKLNREENAPH